MVVPTRSMPATAAATIAGWMSSSWADDYAHMPFTLGHYTREDIPFYYALADAFTICDQHFCSALTCTTPNRLYLWSGTVREKQTADSPAKMNNEEAVYDAEVSWPTFPERLEDHGISWKVYQNEIWLPSGLEGEHDAWLTNFGDNPLEYFTQYNVRFAAQHRRHVDGTGEEFAERNPSAAAKDRGEGDSRQAMSRRTRNNSPKRWPPCGKTSTSAGGGRPRTSRSCPRARRASTRKRSRPTPRDPDYRELITHTYDDGGKERHVLHAQGRRVPLVPRGRPHRKTADRFLARRRQSDSPTIPAPPGTARGTSPKRSNILTEQSGRLEEDDLHSHVR